MGTRSDVCREILEATEPVSSADIAAATGRSGKDVSATLVALVTDNVVERIVGQGGPHKYQVKDQDALTKKANRGAGDKPEKKPAAKTNGAKPPKKKKPRKTAARKYKKREAPARAAPADDATLTFFIDEDGDVQIMRKDGEGETAIIPRADALRLADFLQRVRPMLEAMA